MRGSRPKVESTATTVTDTGIPALRGRVPRTRTYLRISQEDEKDILENQRHETRREALALGMGEPVVYEEIESGGEDNRSEYNRLLSEMRRGDIVIFTRPSRMTRGGIEKAFDFLKRLERAGVGWHFTEYSVLNFDATTPKLVRDIILAVISALDEDYRRQISVATKAAYARRKALAEAARVPFKWGKRGPGKKKRLPPLSTETPDPKKDAPISGPAEGGVSARGARRP